MFYGCRVSGEKNDYYFYTNGNLPLVYHKRRPVDNAAEII